MKKGRGCLDQNLVGTDSTEFNWDQLGQIRSNRISIEAKSTKFNQILVEADKVEFG